MARAGESKMVERKNYTTIATGMALSALACLSTASAGAELVSWQLVTNDCPRLNVDEEIPCGEYGRFYVDMLVPSGDCGFIAEGAEVPPRYVPARGIVSFPSDPIPWELRAASSPDRTSAHRAAPGTHSADPLTLASLEQQAMPTFSPWLAVIDFSGAHGESVRWLAQAIAQQPEAGDVFWLDALTDADEVSDLDVVRQLCAVAERAARQPGLRPIVNMSFGRPLSENDPVGSEPCVHDSLACQIRNISSHLVERDAVLVGSAGMQREWLFPGVLPDVISAGMLDTSAYLADGVQRAVWEMPHRPNAFMPGNSICLRGGWAAPSGASYASAVLSGWFLHALTKRPDLALPAEANYLPERLAGAGCHVLTSSDGRPLTTCSDAVDYLFNGLKGEFGDVCWKTEVATPVRTVLNPASQPQPVAAAALHWSAAVRPTPEGDPCVPCTSSLLALDDLTDTAVIDMGKQSGLQTEDVLDGVYLRLDDAFHLLELSDSDLLAIETGALSELHIAGSYSLLADAGSASLFFSIRNVDEPDCDSPPDGVPACVWLSTPVHRPD